MGSFLYQTVILIRLMGDTVRYRCHHTDQTITKGSHLIYQPHVQRHRPRVWFMKTVSTDLLWGECIKQHLLHLNARLCPIIAMVQHLIWFQTHQQQNHPITIVPRTLLLKKKKARSLLHLQMQLETLDLNCVLQSHHA